MARKRRQKVGAASFAKAMNKILEQYGDQVTGAITPAAEEVADDAVQMLKTTGDYKNLSGDYRRSFTRTTEKTWRGATVIIHNESPEYRLAHLLEHGHMIKNGTQRVYGETRPFKHWKPAEIKAVAEFEKKLREEIENIG